MRFDFIIPASPTPGFISQIAMFRLALDRLGGDYYDARLVAVFGDEVHAELSSRWKGHFARVDVVRVPIDEFERGHFAATGRHRFNVMRSDADLVFMCDADTIIRKPFGDEVLRLAHSNAIGGVIAHYHFPWVERSGDPVADWNRFGQAVNGRDVDVRHRYTLQEGSPLQSPFYINLGFLAGSPIVLRDLDDEMQRSRERVRVMLQNCFDAQVTLALAVDNLSMPSVALPMRYNFPNDPIADRLYRTELDEACIIHYLRTTHFDRQTIFAEKAAFDRLLSLELHGSDLLFQQLVLEITGGAYPFEGSDGP